MAKNKTHSKQKGLSDTELVKKYDNGKINLKKAINTMCETPSPTINKSEKQTKKKR